MAMPEVNDERSRSFSLEGYRHKGKFFDEAYKYSDWNASSMGISRNGRHAILAARRGFLLVDFNNLNEPKKFIHSSKWEPGPIQWNPHAASEELFASVINQKIDIWSINDIHIGTPNPVLSGHTRAISDINWNYFEPSLLLTCSMDTYINLWDLRAPRKPASIFTTVAGSSQVKWNKKNSNIFASAHDGDVRIWDIRHGNIPSIYIAGHLSKIHGLDWSPQTEQYFVTASNDSTVKFWNTLSPKQPRASINNGGPVWKARYTPFGNGLVTVLVPQLRRSENSLFLWNTSEFKSPIHKFDGHSDVILEFDWRIQNIGDQNEYQLVSWSKDLSLRLWTAEKKTLQAITGEVTKSPLSPTPLLTDRVLHQPKPAAQLDTSTSPPVLTSTFNEKEFIHKSLDDRPGSLLLKIDRKSMDIVKSPPKENPSSDQDNALSPLSGQPTAFRKQNTQDSLTNIQPFDSVKTEEHQTLKQEFALITRMNPYYKIDRMDAEQRLCTVSTKLGQHPLKLQISFPTDYPNNSIPHFKFLNETISSPSSDEESKKKIINTLEDVSKQKVKFGRPCMEPCLHQLALQIEMLKTQDIRSDDSLTPMTPPPAHVQSFTFRRSGDVASDSSYLDSTVPFPRTCGARFCGVGDKLVIFSRPNKFNDLVNAERTSRSLSALNAYISNLSNGIPFPDDETESFQAPPRLVGPVYISDTSKLLPVSRFLAENYELNGDDPSELCLKNAELARKDGRKDLVKAWTILSGILSPRLKPIANMEKCYTPPWACHPFGRKLALSLMSHFESTKDVQMLAMMSCMLLKQVLPTEIKDNIKYNRDKNKVIANESSRLKKQNTSDGFQVSPEFPYNVYNRPSSSTEENWSPPTFVEEKLIDPKEDLRQQHYENCRLVRSEDTFRFDQFKRCYSEILYRWNYLMQRTEVSKYISEEPIDSRKICDISMTCLNCKGIHRDPYCKLCKSIIVKCSICRIGVRGLVSFCLVCGHGGHMNHLINWFQQNEVCATGCGCYCLRTGKFSSE